MFEWLTENTDHSLFDTLIDKLAFSIAEPVTYWNTDLLFFEIVYIDFDFDERLINGDPGLLL